LKELNLWIGACEKVEFVGKSGEGKSTLLQLLCRFYAPASGKICIDDIPLEEYTLSSLRSQIAVVQQDNGLFHGSLRKNIILSDEKAKDNRIWEILEGLKMKGLVEELPEGLDTIVGSGGRELSGGQKQRIAIARCIFRQPKILLLDEATSALDAETEQAVNSFLYEQLPQTTILSVAHRFSTVLSAEKIVVMEHGSVADMGTHEELIQRNTLYQILYSEYKTDEQYAG
ncbi:MAG: ATP-binding cassette domain-containing protein, partial [Lachnospiraceae bacterium]|nr:ATP-binding cassette domain-containing protein [Lachnospiraceae bacterium]